MMATVRAALAEAEAVGPTASAERVAAAAAFGALMGARGNSGVITSQILRGLAEGLAGKTRFNALDLANALDQGTKAAYGAVAKPVEGTILTVIREASAAAVVSAEREQTPRRGHGRDGRCRPEGGREDADAARDPARGRRRRLGRAGPVPAVRGRARVPDGRRDGARPAPGAAAVAARGQRGREPGATHGAPPGAGMRDEGFGFETMFLAQAEAGKPLDVDGDPRLLRVDRRVRARCRRRPGDQGPHPQRAAGPGARPTRSGSATLSKITIENLDQQAERRPRDARGGVRRRAIAAARGDRAGSGDRRWLDQPAPSRRADAPALAVVAVAAGEGLAAIFRDFGVQKVVYGGQTANPSTGELLEAVKSVDAREILLLPNNPNVVLAARQVTSMCDRPVAVVATRNAAEGFAALLALDPDKDAADERERDDRRGPRRSSRCPVTEAVRDATVSGKKVKLGQTIALDPDDGLVAVHDDPAKAVLDAVKALSPGSS